MVGQPVQALVGMREQKADRLGRAFTGCGAVDHLEIAGGHRQAAPLGVESVGVGRAKRVENMVAGECLGVGAHLLGDFLERAPGRINLVGIQCAVAVDGEPPMREESVRRAADDVERAMVEGPGQHLVFEVAPDPLVERGALRRHVGHAEGLVGAADMPGKRLARRDMAAIVAAVDECPVTERVALKQVIGVEGIR